MPLKSPLSLVPLTGDLSGRFHNAIFEWARLESGFGVLAMIFTPSELKLDSTVAINLEIYKQHQQLMTMVYNEDSYCHSREIKMQQKTTTASPKLATLDKQNISTISDTLDTFYLSIFTLALLFNEQQFTTD